ncbi:MAG TPA: hypothetical protein VHY31_13980 [Streptosporangiaceae bacterium]|nr:hypothetical protein [Streptosporangiaceae bacterium]
MQGQPDPFGTAELRRRVLDAWTASPARFREDANAEEDYALGGYRDRVVVELAQNAADAAAREGGARPGGTTPQDPPGAGRLRLTLSGGTLVAANTGAPLDAAGVAALSTLRASGKRGSGPDEAAVGRFGVGFAAAVAVSDEPRISSVTGAVAWSRAAARELAEGIPALAAEFAARSGHLPVLRLPFAADGTPPEGFTTAVTLPLRDEDAARLVRALLAETGPALLLALPALAVVEIEIDGQRQVLTASHDGDGVTVTVDGRASRWRTAAAGGQADPGLMADRPAEERARPAWSVRWAVPVEPDGQVPAGRLPDGTSAVVHAPTPTDEPLGLPALLLASFPLSPDRRHVAPGPLTDFLVDQAAQAYAGLLRGLAATVALLDMVPSPVGRGELDARLGRAILARLPETAFLPAADPSAPRIRPRDAVILDASPPGLAAYLAPVLSGLVAGSARHPGYGVLGVRRLRLADLADTLTSLDRDPAWWRGLYEALAAAASGELGELGALPVPLADGRQVRGARGLLLPGPGLEHTERLAPLGLRIVHPDAAHPLLARLGAVEATPRGILADPAVRAAVAASYEEEDPEPVADAVLSLVAAARLQPGDEPWLADLALPGDDGEWYPAGELLLPGGPLAQVVAADSPFGTADPDVLKRHGAATLEAAGVLATFGLLTAQDVALDDPDLDVDGAVEWAADTRARLPDDPVPPVAAEVRAVRDLELVDPQRWPQALELLAVPPLRAALVEPVRVLLADGRHADVPSYTAWWLRRHPVLGGRRPADVRAAGADPLLAGLYEEAALPADPGLARALGVRTSLADLLAEPDGPDELLARLADRARPVTRGQLRALWTALAGVADAEPPDRVRAVLGTEVVVAEAADVLVLDAPDLWPLVAARPLVLAPYDHAEQLADLLDLPLASEVINGSVDSAGERLLIPQVSRVDMSGFPREYEAHDPLTVDGVAVPWRFTRGTVHASGPDGLACGLAWASGRWPQRHLIAALLRDPEAAARLLAEADLDPAAL